MAGRLWDAASNPVVAEQDLFRVMIWAAVPLNQLPAPPVISLSDHRQRKAEVYSKAESLSARDSLCVKKVTDGPAVLRGVQYFLALEQRLLPS